MLCQRIIARASDVAKMAGTGNVHLASGGEEIFYPLLSVPITA